jgi:hypothetical protein
MDRIKLITSKEYWLETIEVMQFQGHSNYDIATAIVSKMEEAINYKISCMDFPDKYLKPELNKYKNIKIERTKGKSDI